MARHGATMIGADSVAGPTDPYYADVSLLLHFDGTNGGTTFTDNSPRPKTVTSTGGALSTAEYKFGTASMHGVGVNIADSSDFDMGSGDFTIEFWVYPTGAGAGNPAIDIYLAGNANGSGYRDFMFGPTGSVDFLYATSAATTYIVAGLTGTTSLSMNTWQHVAWVRNGTSWNVYISGISDSGSAFSSSALLYHNNLGFVINTTNFYIDEMRWTKGVARYTANFTPPTAPFPNS